MSSRSSLSNVINNSNTFDRSDSSVSSLTDDSDDDSDYGSQSNSLINNNAVLKLSKQLNDNYPNAELIDFGINLIFDVINDNDFDNKKNTNKDIYDRVNELLEKKTYKDIETKTKTELLEIIKKLLEILKPNRTFLDIFNEALFKAKTYDETKPSKIDKTRLQVLLYKSVLEGDPNLNYILNIMTNGKNSFLDVENTLAELKYSNYGNTKIEAKPKFDEIIEKELIVPPAGAGAVSSGVSSSGSTTGPASVSGSGSSVASSAASSSSSKSASSAASSAVSGGVSSAVSGGVKKDKHPPKISRGSSGNSFKNGGKNKKRNKKMNNKTAKIKKQNNKNKNTKKHRNKTKKHR